MILTIPLHVLGAVIWVGGMFFAYMALRPAAAQMLEPPLRLMLWVGVFNRFFPWVWVAIAILLLTGFWMVFAVMGGMGGVGLHVHLMLTLGIAMMLIFAHLYFAPFKRLKLAVQNEDWPEGGKRLVQIRRTVGLNLCLGILTVVVATAGHYI
ncbi:hypothetical protein FT643_06735 [Ketobacter sp. MCCC 1A13808]|uniref:CopD family protein n=1 Tax=Ketobacter sp. MCCC 1A13808 TaxID=2602738 RepID=UPI000F1D2657|nr:CopD family protein [Ketobacter sp. MCCC 1A13808]MVF11839.1 hypothetical protein [Ketobacter sp. MCCC 1A13808]RLP55440.1 MAG: hypothetical protein D6160_06775 [Ketobacter sp.]